MGNIPRFYVLLLGLIFFYILGNKMGNYQGLCTFAWFNCFNVC